MWNKLKRLWRIVTCNHPEPEIARNEFGDALDLSNNCWRCPHCNQWFPPAMQEAVSIDMDTDINGFLKSGLWLPDGRDSRVSMTALGEQ